MDSLTTFFESEFNTQRKDWEKSLIAELKLPDIGNKASKKMINGLDWPTLSLDRSNEIQLAPSLTWKKASTTYAFLNIDDIKDAIDDDLKSGVKNFFFHEDALSPEKWRVFEETMKKHHTLSEIEVFILGHSQYTSESFSVVSGLITGSEAHDFGGHAIQELAMLAKNLIQSTEEKIYIGVYVNSHFFESIAKLRAARLLAAKILEEKGNKSQLKVVALTSYMGWTLFERYSNMLRNETAVAAAYIGCADHIQSSGYNTLFELETEKTPIDEHTDRSRRMARNTSHILALESMLGIVEDAAFGSYHLENLTGALCEEAWKLMQRLLAGEDISSEIASTREQRLQMMKVRKLVMSGINDFPDVKEELRLKLKAPSFFRLARSFEELRLQMLEGSRPEVYIALYGDYAALNSRFNFVKNYFELLGLRVLDSGTSQNDLNDFTKNLSNRREEIVVLCALDEHYPLLEPMSGVIKTSHKYIAGKFEMNSFKNLYGGQNVFSVLEDLVSTFSPRKS